ncbi:MAG TPA: zinc ABC transporter substrate-binding protein [Thermoleophilia bacterium]|nr:zinc ABC transporter substrate-binding protein [Thermoleophilia bacterium]
MRRALALAVAIALTAMSAAGALAGCGGASDDTRGETSAGALKVVATASFLADIAQNVAGDRFTVAALVPRGADLHTFEPTPRDLAMVTDSDLLIINGAGLERTFEESLRDTGEQVRVVVASRGLAPRTPQPGEPAGDGPGDGQGAASGAHETDPHFWLDPILVKTYVTNIRDAFAAADPDGAAAYEANAAAYAERLDAVDRWIRGHVATVPVADRKLLMDHVDFGYYADRYGFRIVGAVIPSVTSDAEPSARHLADLARLIRRSGVRAVFVDFGENADLARQLAAETGIEVVDDLRSHSLTGPSGEAPTYIDMMKYDTQRIVEALR